VRTWFWTLVFFGDREAGRAPVGVITGLVVAVLAVLSHVWLSGNWLQETGLGLRNGPAAVLPAATGPVGCPALAGASAPKELSHGG
jgi:hypothetical protein